MVGFTRRRVVGLQSRVQDLIQLLNYYKSDDVRLLGIWGMGGIGKTTIAMTVYEQISLIFEGSTLFLKNIGESWQQHGMAFLQKQLLSGICKTKDTKIHDIESGKLTLKKELCCKRILLILDDVTELDQLKALCGSRDWFGPGSRIIITTRDKHPLNVFGVDDVYTVKEMDYNKSIELFSWHAFLKETPPEGRYRELAELAVEYCGGLPLALAVLGFLLWARPIEEWESALQRFKINSSLEIWDTLKKSFDSLSDNSLKKIFLDITCFFVGMNQNDVIKILNGSGHNAEIGIKVLEDKCLVTVDKENKLQMHNLLQRMGREIVRQASPVIPKVHSRLWFHEDMFVVSLMYLLLTFGFLIITRTLTISLIVNHFVLL